MENLSVILMLLAMLLFIVSLIILIVRAIRHKKKKTAVIGILLSVVMFIISVIIMPTDMSTDDPTGNTAALIEELEIFTAEYCMAYMDYLVNPYSFTVESAWAHAITEGDNAGKYSVYVRFTAENGMGGTVAEAIGAEVIGNEELQNFYPEIHTWGSEPAYKTSGYGLVLDAAAVQEYIDQNY